MLITKYVKVKWNNTNKDRYLSLGYKPYIRGEEIEIT